MATISGSELLLPRSAPSLTPKTLTKPSLVIPPKAPTGPILQRIDVEPIYTALKSAVAEHWPLYKESFSLYMTGQLNQEELSRRIDSFICIDSARSHLHNQLVCAVYTNAQRDAPEPGVAGWVSANDKPTAVTKPVSGDKVEMRLKTEIMSLPPRERMRLKALQEDGTDVYTQLVNAFHAARQMNRIPDLVPSTAGGYNKTSEFMQNESYSDSVKTNTSQSDWEIEIHKRYTQPLFAESNEFPEPETIQARMVPICYEEGLVQGAATGCSDFVNVAAETCIRELLADMFHRIRTNGPTFVQTTKYKRRLMRQEISFNKGTLQKDATGLLPIEVEAAASRKPLGLNDFRLALDLGNTFMSQLRLVSDRINIGYRIDDEDDAGIGIHAARAAPVVNGIKGLPKINGHLTNGIVNGVNGINGINGAIHDEPEEMDWSWSGGKMNDCDGLNSILDECMTIGQ